MISPNPSSLELQNFIFNRSIKHQFQEISAFNNKMLLLPWSLLLLSFHLIDGMMIMKSDSYLVPNVCTASVACSVPGSNWITGPFHCDDGTIISSTSFVSAYIPIFTTEGTKLNLKDWPSACKSVDPNHLFAYSNGKQSLFFQTSWCLSSSHPTHTHTHPIFWRVSVTSTHRHVDGILFNGFKMHLPI